MANPFDFNEDEASRNFEKSVIFGNVGTSPRDSEARDFMKTSLAAANMLYDDDADDDLSSVSMSARGSACKMVLNKNLKPSPIQHTSGSQISISFEIKSSSYFLVMFYIELGHFTYIYTDQESV